MLQDSNILALGFLAHVEPKSYVEQYSAHPGITEFDLLLGMKTA